MAAAETMYTLGQIARAIWPAGNVPPTILDALLVKPASGLALAVAHKDAKRADADDLAALVAKLPADLSDPRGGVKMQDQGPFWLGHYHYLAALDHADRWGAAHLTKAGTLLFGDRWQSDLARAIGVSDRSVRGWVAGERKPPAGVWADIAALLRQRSNEGLALLRELDHH